VQVPPLRLIDDSLSAHTDQTRFLEGEAGNRAQSDICYGVTLVLMGSSQGKTEPRKATYAQARHNRYLDLTGDKYNSRRIALDSGKSPGNPVVELAIPNGTINLTEGTKKNE